MVVVVVWSDPTAIRDRSGSNSKNIQKSNNEKTNEPNPLAALTERVDGKQVVL